MMKIEFARVIDRLEQCFAAHDLSGAERLLLYWQAEADAMGDLQGSVQVANELLGLYRRTNERDKALEVAARLLPRLDTDNVGDATVKLNIATNYCHFGLAEQAAPLYAEVQETYNKYMPAGDYRWAGLYNNMATMATAARDYREAERLYQKALYVIGNIEPVMPELAVAWVNLATAKYRQNPLDAAVDDCMQAAYRTLLREDMPHDGACAFVLGKVLPMFKHLGYTEECEALTALLHAIEGH